MALAGRAAAFELFYNNTARKLRAYIYRVCGDAALADDLTQDAYCRFLRAAKPVMSDGEMKSYLFRIATNLLNDHYRRQKRERSDHLYNAGEHVTTEQGSYEMQQALGELNLQERSMLWLAYVEGENHQDIAQIMGLKEKSIRVLLFRARRRLADPARPQQ